jgi:hypothetical protein
MAPAVIATVPVACPCGYVVWVPPQYAACIAAGFANGCRADPGDPKHHATEQPVQAGLWDLEPNGRGARP